MQAVPTGNDGRVSLVVTQEELDMLYEGIGYLYDYFQTEDSMFDNRDPEKVYRLAEILDSVRDKDLKVDYPRTHVNRV